MLILRSALEHDAYCRSRKLSPVFKMTLNHRLFDSELSTFSEMGVSVIRLMYMCFVFCESHILNDVHT